MSRIQELINASQINELLKKKEKEEQSKQAIKITLIVIGALTLVAGIAYAIYYFFATDYIEDYEDEFEDDLDDEFFDETDK